MVKVYHAPGTRSVGPVWLCYELELTVDSASYHQWCWFAEAKLHASRSVVDDALAGRDYLLGADFTAADIMMGYSVGLLERVMGDGYPNATAYLNRLTSRPASRRLADLEA